MNNVLRIDTNTVEQIKNVMNEMRTYLDNVDNKINQCNSMRDLNIEADNIQILKNNIIQNMNNLNSLISNITTFHDDVMAVNDYKTESLINLRNSYKKINTK